MGRERGEGHWVCELPMYLQQNMYSQSIIFFIRLSLWCVYLQSDGEDTFYNTNLWQKTFLPIYLGILKFALNS